MGWCGLGRFCLLLFELLQDATWAKRGETGCGATPGCPPIAAGGALGQPVALGFEEGAFLCLIFKEQELLVFLMQMPSLASGDLRIHHLALSKPRQDASAEASTGDTQTWSFMVTSVLENCFRSQFMLVSSVPTLAPQLPCPPRGGWSQLQEG